MKRSTKLIGLASVALALAIGAQQVRAASVNVDASATIVAPLGIAEIQPLNFGAFAQSDSVFSVTVDANGGPLTLLNIEGHFGNDQPALVDITGPETGSIAMTFVTGTLAEPGGFTLQLSDITCSFDGGPTQAPGSCVAFLDGAPNVMSLGGKVSSTTGGINGVYTGVIEVTANGN